MVTPVNGLDIKIARLKAGFRQYDLAAKLAIPPSRLSEIESGRRKPSPELLERLLQVLDDGEWESLKLRRDPRTRGAANA